MKRYFLAGMLFAFLMICLIGAAKVYITGDKITATWLNLLYGPNGHKHDGADADGHAPKVNLRDHTTGDIRSNQHPETLFTAMGIYMFSDHGSCADYPWESLDSPMGIACLAAASPAMQVWSDYLVDDGFTTFFLNMRGATIAPNLEYKAAFYPVDNYTNVSVGLRCQNAGAYDAGTLIVADGGVCLAQGGVTCTATSPCAYAGDIGPGYRGCRWEVAATGEDGGIPEADAASAGIKLLRAAVRECDAGN